MSKVRSLPRCEKILVIFWVSTFVLGYFVAQNVNSDYIVLNADLRRMEVVLRGRLIVLVIG